MTRLTSKQATVYAIIAFVFTLAVSYFLPGYPITLCGLLVVIFLSVFFPNVRPTLITATGCIIFTFLHYWITGTEFTQHLFIILLSFLITVIVLYLKKLYKQLNFEKSHMTALFENATEGIILTEEDGNIILANAAAEKMFGYGAKEMVRKPVELLLPQKARSKHVQLRHGFYEKPEHRSMGSGRDLYATKKSGEDFPVEVSLSYYYKGDTRYVIAFIVDITQRKQIEQSMQLQKQQLENVSNEFRNLNADLEVKVEDRTMILKEALQKLEQSQQELSNALDKERQLSEIKSRFVSMASHEFRTPLSTVLSSASLLSKYVKDEDQEKRDKHIDRIKGAVKNLNNILEDFLSLGKLDEGKIKPVTTPFQLGVFIDETTEDVKGLLKDGQKIICKQEDTETIYSDKKLLKNVLLNLISNAIKFSDKDITVEVSSLEHNHNATIKISDQGLGISKMDQAHLFTSFFRGANVVNIEGTGLGLHIVKRYLELLGGSITVESELNKGTSFTITIPTNSDNHGQDNISD